MTQQGATLQNYNNELVKCIEDLREKREALIAMTVDDPPLPVIDMSALNVQCLIGNALRGSASYAAALIEYREALRIQEAELGVGHPSTAACYHNIGVVLKRKAMDESMEDDGGMASSGFSAALDSLQKSLTIKMDSMDEYDSSIARTREAIGKLLAKMGDLDGATIQLQGCLAIQRATIGENHPDTAACYNVIGEVLQKKGDPEGALSMLRRSLTIREAVFGKDHPRTANSKDVDIAVHPEPASDTLLVTP